MKQTAVEWLVNQLKDVKYNPLEKNGYSNALDKLYAQAKAMEKEQIMNAFDIRKVDIAFDKKTTSEQYYIENYETIRKP
jgi:hypothetical protein